MDIEPIDFLEARASINYLTQVFNLDLDNEMYMFHIYNLAMQLSLISNRPSNAIKHMANKDDFVKIMGNFKDRYWEIINSPQQ